MFPDIRYRFDYASPSHPHTSIRERRLQLVTSCTRMRRGRVLSSTMRARTGRSSGESMLTVQIARCGCADMASNRNLWTPAGSRLPRQGCKPTTNRLFTHRVCRYALTQDWLWVPDCASAVKSTILLILLSLSYPTSEAVP